MMPLPYTYTAKKKQEPSDKEQILLPLHPYKSNADPDTRAEWHLLISVANSVDTLMWYLQRK